MVSADPTPPTPPVALPNPSTPDQGMPPLDDEVCYLEWCCDHLTGRFDAALVRRTRVRAVANTFMALLPGFVALAANRVLDERFFRSCVLDTLTALAWLTALVFWVLITFARRSPIVPVVFAGETILDRNHVLDRQGELRGLRVRLAQAVSEEQEQTKRIGAFLQPLQVACVVALLLMLAALVLAMQTPAPSH